MIIKKYTSPNFLAWLNAYFFSSKYAYGLGVVGLLFILMLFIFGQNEVKVTPNEHFFSQPVEVKLRSTDIFNRHSIHYTTDGSSPTVNSDRYQKPFTLEKTTALRMALFQNGQKVSDTFTHPIFISTTHQMSVISIVTDYENLFDPETGIYVQHNNGGSEWERPAHMTFFEPNGEQGFKKDIGLRIHGGGSRTNAQKSLRIYAGYLDHDDQIKYPLFPNLPYSTFNTFILRASGGDWQQAFIRDAVMQTVANDLTEVDASAVRPAVVYINGEYWGVYFIQERIDEYYLANKYGISKDKLSIVDIPQDTGPKRGKVRNDYGSNKAVDAYNNLYDKSLASCKGCSVYGEFSPHMDLANFQDYLLLQIFSGNFDWPFGNVKLWRYEQPTIATENEKSSIDGRFRWIFFDLDTGLGFANETEAEMINSAQNRAYNRLDDTSFPFLNLFLNEKFRQEYLTRSAELLNSSFTVEYLLSVIDELETTLKPEMAAQVARWADQAAPNSIEMLSSVEEWEHNVELLRVFVKHRHSHMFQSTSDFYDITGIRKITLDSTPSGTGAVSIGAIHKSHEELPWEGTFFQDTAMAIEAHPNKGYIFDHWEGDIPHSQKNMQRVVIPIKDQEKFTAVFKKRQWYEYIISTK